MKYLYILILVIHLDFPPIVAQNCGFIFKKDEKIESITEGYIHNNLHNLSTRAVVKIPVVVHVVWKNAQENISDAQIQSQIDVLNQDFRKKNGDLRDVPGNFRALAADCEIEFCLATKDTLGNSTTGIVRRQTSVDEIGSVFRRVYSTTLGGSNNWKPENYLNIWVCNMGNNLLGFTSPLKDAAIKPQEDGVIVDYRAFGTIGTAANNTAHNKGRTATHEIGHYLNLLHIWGIDDTCNDDDLVNDTPLQGPAYRGCPSFPQLTCGISNMYMNFMDYTDDNCMGLFTVGQKARMLAALNEFRPGLLRGSTACEPTSVSTTPLFNWMIYPNPVANNLYLNIDSALLFKNRKVEISDVLGRILIEKNISETSNNTIEISLNNISNGIYIVSLNLDNQVFMKKITVNK
jgi:Secretion system C-terminal sorting domain/Pregnancy-associated plasma protein-A